MNILYAVKQKGRIILLLLALGGLLIVNCNAYNRNIAEMGDSVAEVYADRLIAQDYIYKLSGKIHERKWELHESLHKGGDFVRLPGAHSLSILVLLRNYEKTKFTPDEKKVYDQFRENIFMMIALQQRYGVMEEGPGKKSVLTAYESSLNLSLGQLEKLSEIQMQRGRSINVNSQKIVSFTYLLNQLDWALIVILCVMIMAFIFAAKSTFPKQLQNHLMN